jgi:exopolysaccharide biosynthesis polyprenyl glycosylphosphotransferase
MASDPKAVARSLTFAERAAGLRAVDPSVGQVLEEPNWLGQSLTPERTPSRSRARRIGGRWVCVSYWLIDVFFILVNGALAFLTYFSASDIFRSVPSGHLIFSKLPSIVHYGSFVLLDAALVTLFCKQQDLYWTPRTRSSAEESAGVVKAVSYATLLLVAFLYLSDTIIVSRLVVGLNYVLNVAALVAWRAIKRKVVIRRVARGIGARNALIVGTGRIGRALAQHLQHDKLLGYRFVGFLDGNDSGDPLLLGRVEDLDRVVRSHFVDDIFITIPSEREVVKRVAIEARRTNLSVKVVPDLYDGLGWCAPVTQIGHFPVIELQHEPISPLGLVFKRIFDVLLAAFALIALSPFLGVVAVAIYFDSSGPILYRSRRVGKKGHAFTCCKFRTMVSNADDLKASLRARNERSGPFFKIREDPRVTRLGRFLRKYSIDELPQLWNVFCGDMSLVGPRPHPVDDYEQYTLEHLRRLEVKPGITGLWQVNARQDPSFETNMALDLEYIENWEFWIDVRILLQTLPAVMEGNGQ